MKRNFYPLVKLTFYFFACFVSSQLYGQMHIYTAPNGSSTADGTSSSTPVNLARARAIAKANPQKAVTIDLASGIYPQLTLDATDSRSANAPVVYSSAVQGGAIFQPTMTLTAANFSPIPAAIQSRIINATAKTKVVQMSLASYNFKDTAQWPLYFAIGALKSPKFYKDGIPLPMSRYPADTSNMTMAKVVTGGTENSTPGGSFKYRNDRIKYWQTAINDGGVWLSGNWQYPWQVDVIKTQSVNTADSVILQAIGLAGGLGTKYASRVPVGAEPYYAVNLVEEIAKEGDWAINFKTKMLYMWLPSSGTLTVAGTSKTPAISLTSVSNTQFVNIAIRGGSGNGIELNKCVNVLVAGSHITYCSGNGVVITDGSWCTVQSCDIDSVGAGGVIISTTNFKDDQFNVRQSMHKVINNHIYSYAREAFLYSAAVNITNAIGTYVAHNKVHDSPHVGIMYGGNSNILEYNEVYDICKKYTDMGAFYTWCGTADVWTRIGNQLHHNYIHDAPQANGIYEDSYSSGDNVSYNICSNIVMALYNHLGYFNAYSNNICINDMFPVTTMVQPSSDPVFATNLTALKTLWNASPKFKAAYPNCVDMVGPSGVNAAYTSKLWPSVTGNVFIDNVGVLSNVIDHRIFYDDGTTNALYAQTGPAFTTWGTVFLNNIKMPANKLANPIVPFKIDSLRGTGGFGLTQGKDWHVNRIGIHKDLYRKDITSVKVPGIDPTMTLTDTSTTKFKNPGTVVLINGVKFPNAGSILTSVTFYDNGKPMTGVTVTKKVVNYDSASYTILWSNPPAGYHNIVVVANDGDGVNWQYKSNAVGFTVTAATTTAAAKDSTVVIATTETQATNTDSVATTIARHATTDSTGQGDLNAGLLTLYPNPASSLINISYTSPKAQSNTNVLIYDLLGRVLVKKTLDIQEGPNQISLPLNNMPDGIYLMVLQTQHNPPVSRRFMVRRS
ncbi:MAG TPA: T9SS type A sorting domain-containing protein [Puia sp.]|nr:T9SS type A sorting domain-containing protein [Puia sp.]